MKGAIKNILYEELENSLKMKKGYEKSLKKLPPGCIIAKEIKGHTYYYLARREGKKVRHIYKRKLSAAEIKKYNGFSGTVNLENKVMAITPAIISNIPITARTSGICL